MEQEALRWQLSLATVKQKIYASMKPEEVCRWGVDAPAPLDLDSCALTLREDLLVLTAVRSISGEAGEPKVKVPFVKRNGGKVWKEVLERGEPILWENWSDATAEDLGLPKDLFTNGGPGGSFPVLLDGEKRKVMGILCVIASNGRGPIASNEKTFLSEVGKAMGSALDKVETINVMLAERLKENLKTRESLPEEIIRLKRKFLHLYNNKDWREKYWGKYVAIISDGDIIMEGEELESLADEVEREYPESYVSYHKVALEDD